MTTANDRTNGTRWEDRKIPLDQLEISEWNVRNREITADLDELAHSMAEFDLQQPIVVQPKGDKFEILIGQRRYLAAQKLGWLDIPARIRSQGLNEFDAKVVSLSENIQRRDLAPRDKADACVYLLGRLHTVAAVAQHLGSSVKTVRKWLGFAAVPDSLKLLVDDRKISPQMATRLAQSVPNEQSAVAIAERIAELRPPKEERDRILDAAEEFPDRSVDVIMERARETRVRRPITIVLPERWALAIDDASRALDKEPEDIAKEATIEWLDARQF